MMRKKFWAPLIAAALLLLYGCGHTEPVPTPTPAPTPVPPEELLQGEWVCRKADMTGQMHAALAYGGNEALLALCEMPVLLMDLELQLNTDGTFTLTCSEEDSREGITAVTAAMEEGVREYLLATVRAALSEKGIDAEREYEKYGCADETAFAELSLGMTLEEVFARMGLPDMAESRWNSALDSGVWAVEDGVLTLNGAAAEHDAAADTIMFESRTYTRK